MNWDSIWDFLGQLVHPESIIRIGGLALLTAVIFAETGLLIGFFLPGDSLLFTAGLLTALGTIPQPIWLVVLCIFGAAVAGDQLGYYIGYRGGPLIFNKKESLFFKPEYVAMTRSFYDKHGAKALIFGHWIPIIRTFAPVMAGVVQQPYPRFLALTTLGSAAWTFVLTLMGYFLGTQIPWIKDYLEYIIIAFIVITAIPVVRTFMKEARLRKETAAKEAATAAALNQERQSVQ